KGFSPGAYDESLGQYVVKFEDAHSWVEVHLPHTGWMRMEPTPSEGIRFAAGSVATNENNILSLKERIDRFVWGDSKQRMRLFMQLFGWLVFIGSLSGLLYLVAGWIVSSRARSCRWL